MTATVAPAHAARRHRGARRVLGAAARLVVSAAVVVAVVAVGTLAAVTVAAEHGRGDDAPGRSPFAGRPGVEPGDAEVAIGQPGEAGGLRVVMLDGGYVPELSGLEPDGYVVVRVQLENTTGVPLAFTRADWSARTPLGAEVPAAVTTQPGLGSGTLAPGARAEGVLRFEVGHAPGYTYVVLAPPGAASRLVWRLVTPREAPAG